MLCKQGQELNTTDSQDEDEHEGRVQVILLHAQQVKAEFAWATVTPTGLKIDHSAINAFKLSQKELVPVPDLVNYQLRDFKLTRWLGRAVLFWTLINWAELPMEWVNRTAMSIGGKAGQSNLFYGPVIISVLKLDMVDPKTRTLDHVQMRTLRQVADYIQMVDDNPCVPNPDRFKSVPPRLNPVRDLVPIPGIKVNDMLELELMAPFGMTASKEEVTVAISNRRQEQCAAAVPFVLGLKWYTRSANLDVVVSKKSKVSDRVDENLAWFQWTLESTPSATKTGQQKARAKYAHHDRSLVVVQVGGAPLRIEHVQALTRYLGQQQASDKHRANISKEGFLKYWNDRDANTRGSLPSPYDLEADHSENLVGEDANELMALVAENEKIKYMVLNSIAVRVEVLMKRLMETYVENQQVVKIINALTSYCFNGRSIKDMRAEIMSGNMESHQDLEAVRVLTALSRTHLKPELCQMAEYIGRYEEEDYLSWFRRDEIQ